MNGIYALAAGFILTAGAVLLICLLIRHKREEKKKARLRELAAERERFLVIAPRARKLSEGRYKADYASPAPRARKDSEFNAPGLVDFSGVNYDHSPSKFEGGGGSSGGGGASGSWDSDSSSGSSSDSGSSSSSGGGDSD